MRSLARLALVSLLCVAGPAALGESVFDFENVASGSSIPLALTINGLTASFTGDAAVCVSAGYTSNMFVALTGNALMQGFCTSGNAGPLGVHFSQPVGRLSFGVAINGTTPVPITVSYALNGVTVGAQTVQPAVPNGSLSPEATVTYTGMFDSVTIASTGLLALDNVDALPSAPTAH